MKFTNSNDALVHIRLCFRVRLMQHTFVTLTGGAGLVGIDSRNDNDFVRDLIRNFAQSGDILQNRLAMVSRAWADYKDKFIRLPIEHRFDVGISLGFYLCHTLGQGKLGFYILGNGKFSVESHLHVSVPLFLNI